MNLLYYLAEANLYLGVFYLAYCLFLTKETYYQLSRVYLLTGCVLSFIIPLMQLGFLKHIEPIGTDTTSDLITSHHFTWEDGIFYGYLIGFVIYTVRFIIKLYQLKKLTRLNATSVNDKYKLIYIEGSDTAFSFFNYLFIGTKTTESALIAKHELVHIRQKHSVDVVFLEILQIINWFSPIIYLLQNSLKTVHEYIADEKTVAYETDALSYSTFLLNNAYGISGPSITHSFFNYNLLKKRIIMLNQQRSGSLARLKYLMAVPLCMGLLCESTLGFSKTYGVINIGNTATAVITDTVPKKKLPPPPPPIPPKKSKKVIDVVLPPPPPPAKPMKGKLPPPVIKSDQRPVKFPPPVITTDKKKPSNRPVKFPPPIVKKDKP